MLAIAVLGGLIGAVMALASGRSVRLLLMGGFFLSSIAMQLDYYGFVLPTLLAPLQRVRTEAVGGLSLLLWLSVLVHGLRNGALALPSQTLMLLVLGLYAGAMRVVHSGVNEATFSVVFATVTIPVVSMAVLGYVRDHDDVLRLLRGIAVVGIVWTFFVGLQFLANRNYLTLGNRFRFMGLLSNPQHAGAFVGSVLVVTFWLVTNDPARSLRMIWIGSCAALSLMLLWTGSRTALLMFIVGISVAMYARFGKLILWAPVGAIAIFVALKLAEMLNIDLLAGRLASLENTREVVWRNMIRAGLSSPLTGVGQDDAGGSENGYLYGFSSFGVGMVLLMFAYTAVSAWVCLRLFVLRRQVSSQWKALIDVVLGLTALYYAGGMFEGYFLARVSPNHFLMLIVSGLASVVFKLAPAAAVAEQFDDSHGYDEAVAPVVPAGGNYGEGYNGPYVRS